MIISGNEIISKIAKINNLSVRDITDINKSKAILRARREAYFCLWALKPKYGMPWIGNLTNKHHTSVLDGVRHMCQEFGLDYNNRSAAFAIAEKLLNRPVKAVPIIVERKLIPYAGAPKF